MHLGPYEVLKPIGRGGQGVVYSACSPDGTHVAIKLLQSRSGEAHARFEREQRLLRSFGEAEGFVPLIDAGMTEEGPYLVMPLIPGGTLREKLDLGPLGVEATIELARKLAGALGKAHERGVVHRDMKPENVLFAADGRPLITDLGLAKHFDLGAKGASQTVDLTKTDAFRGTAGYAAREQMFDVKSVGPTADVFALGAILYECLAGRPAFSGPSRIELAAQVELGQFEKLAVSGAPPAFLTAIERALAREPADRFVDALAFAHALAPVRASRRLPRVVAACFLTLTLALLGAAVAVRDGTRAPPPARGESPPGEKKSAAALVVHGDEKAAQGDLAGSIADFGRALELDPGLSRAWLGRARAEVKHGDLDAAIRDYSRAIELEPTLGVAWFDRGLLRHRKGDLAGSIADFTKAIAFNPGATMAFVFRGEARARKGDLEGAIDDATRAIALEPACAPAWKNRGTARAEKADWQEAISDLDRALELEPEDAGALETSCYCRSKTGDWGGAIATATRAIELDPALYRPWAVRALARFTKGDNDGAVADATAAIARDPKLSLAYSVRGRARRAKDDREGATEDATSAVLVDPENVSCWVFRSAVRRETGDTEGALADASRAIELDARDSTGWANRALAHGQKHEWGATIADATRALELEPGHAQPWCTRGMARQQVGDVKGALADLERFLELAPNDPEAAGVRQRVAELR